MKNNTNEKILDFIKKGGKSANKIITYFSLNASGVFRHLIKLQKNGDIYKVGKPPKVTYYVYNNMKNISKITESISNWALSGDMSKIKPDIICPTRDIFQARSEKHLNNLIKNKGEQTAYLLLAIIGEIGFNSFDHNLGNWRDIMGAAFYFDSNNNEIALADRGQGIRATISRVRPNVASDKEAMEVAFNEMVSGRHPEQRGNGLKYVKKVIMENNFRLNFYSGNSECAITSNGILIKEPSPMRIPGTLAIIKF